LSKTACVHTQGEVLGVWGDVADDAKFEMRVRKHDVGAKESGRVRGGEEYYAY
jgi:predicted DNA-binding protein with PD1-like motif